jgi:cell division protein FtsB
MSDLNLKEILDSVSEPVAEAPEAAPTPEEDSTPPPPQNMTNPEEKPEEKPEPDHYERSWAAIKAAEKRNLQERNQVKEQRQELDGLRQQLDAAQAQIAKLQGGFMDNPVEFLEKSGLTFDDLANRVLNDGAASPEELIRRTKSTQQSELEQLREEQVKLRQTIQEQQNERMVREYQADVKKALQGDEFELMRDYPDAENLIFNLASSYASEHGEVLTPSDAARRVQSELVEQLKSLKKSAAVRALLGLQDAPTNENPSTEKIAKSPSGDETKTLTNAISSTPPAEVPDRSKLSEYEILREASKLINPSDWA